MRFSIPFYFLAVILCFIQKTAAQDTIVISDSTKMYLADHGLQYQEDKEGKISFPDILKPEYAARFKQSDNHVLNFGITNSTFWLKLKVKNANTAVRWDLLIDEPQVSNIKIYEQTAGDKILFETGFLFPYSERPVKSTTYAFPLHMQDTFTHSFYIRIHSNSPLILPLYFVTEKKLFAREGIKNIAYGLYYGIFTALFLYNLFLLFTLKDKAYIYYLFSIFGSFLMFSTITGYTLIYLFPDAPHFNRYLLEISAVIFSIASALFTNELLQVKKCSRFLYYALILCIAIALSILVEIALGNFYTIQDISYNLLTFQVFITLACAIVSYRKGITYASYLIVAWFGYMAGGLLILGRDQGFLPYNEITTHSAEAGSALEIILFSLALSKRYQIYRHEKEVAIQYSLSVQKDVNETLENKVTQRTNELENTLQELKSAQVQLIQAEKMASLGLLNAGVAHEINNPINHVTAGMAALQKNYDDISVLIKEAFQLVSGEDNKEKIQKIIQISNELEIPAILPEMDLLFHSVNNGANKISEIVKGLRNFSRLDESEVKTVNLEEGLDATLSIINVKLGSRIRIVKDYGNIPPVNCLASLVNQVFINLLNNAIDAIEGNGEICIKTEEVEGDKVRITIRDNGKGIPENIKSHIFDPFFTTKPEGKGAGLGLSITSNIIKKHNGEIFVKSAPGKGSEFIVELDENCMVMA